MKVMVILSYEVTFFMPYVDFIANDKDKSNPATPKNNSKYILIGKKGKQIPVVTLNMILEQPVQ